MFFLVIIYTVLKVRQQELKQLGDRQHFEVKGCTIQQDRREEEQGYVWARNDLQKVRDGLLAAPCSISIMTPPKESANCFTLKEY